MQVKEHYAERRTSTSHHGVGASAGESHGYRSDEPLQRLGGYHPSRSQRSRSEEHTSELQSLTNLVCRLLLEKKKDVFTAKAASVLSVCLDAIHDLPTFVLTPCVHDSQTP